MQDSPALALRLIREANQQAQSSLSEPAESLEVAINRLGLKRTQMLLEHVPALAIEDIPLAYRQIQLISKRRTTGHWPVPAIAWRGSAGNLLEQLAVSVTAMGPGTDPPTAARNLGTAGGRAQ